MNSIKISIIIPVYNKAEYIHKCIESVLEQTICEKEIICVDDGSTDGSTEILERYCKEGRIVLLRQENSGAGAARNRGIDYSHGEYLAFMDADDYYYSADSLKKLYIAAKKNKMVLCSGKIKVKCKDGKEIDFDYNQIRYGVLTADSYSKIYGQTAFIFLREFIVKNNIEFPNYKRFEDPPFLLNCIIKAGKFYSSDAYVYCIRAGVGEKDTRYETARDILKGVLDCYILAKNYNLVELYSNHLKHLLYDLYEYYYKYAIAEDEEIITLLKKIHMTDICFRKSSELIEVGNLDDIENYIKNTKMEYNSICGKEVIVYGCGSISELALQNALFDDLNIIGFAVSCYDGMAQFRMYPIKKIEDYDRDKTVIICANLYNSKEMSSNLINYGFKDFLIFDANKVLTLIELKRMNVI